MPAHTAPPACYRSDGEFWGRLVDLDDGNLHLWYGVTPFHGADIDVLILDPSIGVFGIEAKSLQVSKIRHIDMQALARTDGVVGPSPFAHAIGAARALGVALDRVWEERPELIPVAAFSAITRGQWKTKFTGDPAAAFAERCILADDLENIDCLRARLRAIAANPVGSRRQSPEFAGLAADAPGRIKTALDDGKLVSPAGSEGEARAILPLLGEVVQLVNGPGTYYGSPGGDSLSSWKQALAELNVRLRVSVVGEFKAGKSTLINALLGRTVCFVDEFEATTITAAYQPSDEEDVIVAAEDGTTAHCSIEEFLDACARRETAGIKAATIRLKSDLPFEITDTPGLGSHSEGHAEQAETEIRRSDLLLWAIDSNDAGSARESAFIQRAREIGLPIIALLTKADSVSWQDLQLLVDYVAAETGAPQEDIIPVSAYLHAAGEDAGFDRLLGRLREAAASRVHVQQAAYGAKVSEAASAARSVLRYLQEINAPHARFLAAERGYVEAGAAGIGRAGRAEWLRVLRDECREVARSLDVHSAEDAKMVEIVLSQMLPEAVERATAKFVQSLRRLVRDEWRGALEQRSHDFERRIADLMVAKPDAKADLEFLRTQRDAFRHRANVIGEETETAGFGGKIWVMGIGAAASVLTVSFVPIAVAGVIAGLAMNGSKSRSALAVGTDPIIAARIEDALVSSFDAVAEAVERTIERIVGDIAIRSVIKLVNRRGGPDFHTILVIERHACDLMDDLAAIH